MTDTINGRTPEEIKRWLHCEISQYNHSCEEYYTCYACPNFDLQMDDRDDIPEATLAYIQQLERERDEARNDLDTLSYANTELHSAYEAMKRERDAAMEDIHEAAMTGCLCYVCSHNEKGHCKAFDHGIFEATVMCGQYEWRGTQEVE